MTHRRIRIAIVTAVAVITATACVFEAAGAKADDSPTDGVTRTELRPLVTVH